MGLAARLRQAAEPVPAPPGQQKLRVKMTGGRREIARARYPAPDGGMTEMVLMQSPPYYMIWRWDKQKHVFKSKDPAATLKKWAELMRKLKAKLLPKDELMKMESARFAIAALSGKPYVCRGPHLHWTGKFVQTLSGETVRVAYHWTREVQDTQTVEAAGDINVRNVEYVSDQFPDDDNDPEGVADVRVQFDIKGPSLAKLMGKQQRVMEKALAQMDQRQALKLLDSRMANMIFKQFVRPIQKLLSQTAQEEFGRDARLDPRSIVPTEDESYFSAKIDPKKGMISYEIEVESFWKWK